MTDLLEEATDGVAVLTMNRPDRLNALSFAMLDAMLEALTRLAATEEVGVVVLTGAGRGFSAGGDVKAMAEGREAEGDTLEQKAQALRARMETSRWLHEMGKPTINRVVPDADLEGETRTLATKLARGPRVAYRYMKRNMNAAESGTLAELLDLEAWHHSRTGETEDHREAARAFVDKREPLFRGR